MFEMAPRQNGCLTRRDPHPTIRVGVLRAASDRSLLDRALLPGSVQLAALY